MPAGWRPSSAASRHLLPASGEKALTHPRVNRPAEPAQRLRVALVQHRLDLRDDGQRDLLRRLAAEVEADRRVESFRGSLAELGEELVAARLRPEEADVRDRAGEDGGEQ